MNDQHQAALRQHTPMAKRIALGFIRRLPCTVLAEDVEQAALIGLWDGLRRRGDDANAQHPWYLKMRIRGAILDELRTQDWLPRRARKGVLAGQRVATIVRFADLGCAGTGEDDSEYPWEERFAAATPDPSEALDIAATCAEAWRAPLDARLRKVIHMTEVRGMKFKDVADDFGVSEPRISQLHARALLIMRKHLANEPNRQEPSPSDAFLQRMRNTHDRDPISETTTHHINRRSDRTASSRADSARPAQPDVPPVRASGLGDSPPGIPARPVQGGTRIFEIHRAACAVLQRVVPAQPCRALIDPTPIHAQPEPVSSQRGGSVSALQVALPAEGLDMRAELAECQAALVTQALSRAGGDLTAAAKLLSLTPLELARAQGLPAAPAPAAPPRAENPVMKQPPTAPLEAPPSHTIQRPKLVGALAALPENERLPIKPEFGRIEKGLLKIDSAVIERLDCEGYTPQQIGRRLGVNPYFVERVLRMLAEPMRKCGPKPRGEKP